MIFYVMLFVMMLVRLVRKVVCNVVCNVVWDVVCNVACAIWWVGHSAASPKNTMFGTQSATSARKYGRMAIRKNVCCWWCCLVVGWVYGRRLF